MTTFDSPERRAANVLSSNIYLALASSNSSESWTCVLSYTLGRGGVFHFASPVSSRHSRLIQANSAVSGVVYDSRATMDSAESFQFSGSAELIPHEPDKLRDLFANSLRRYTADQLADKVASAIASPARYFRVTVERGFVLDQAAWQDAKVDKREEATVSDVFSIVEAQA